MKNAVLIFLTFMSLVSLSAQDKGYLTGSLESNNHLYVDDAVNNSFVDRDGHIFASNNYLKLDYYKGRFSSGLQMEGYFPALTGYPDLLDRFALSNIYAAWKDEDFSVTAGTFYDQFGSGMLFRSWEDRVLGLNNALLGARLTYNWQNKIAFKAMWGLPRLGMSFADSQVRGADLSVSISELAGLDNMSLSVEGSVLSRYEPANDFQKESGLKPNSFGWSGRLNMEVAGFFFKGEYVDMGKQWTGVGVGSGNAQLVELGYNGRGLGVTLTGRRLVSMQQRIISNDTSHEGYMSQLNMMSYVPAMCTQYTYMLTTLNPYNPYVDSGEMGGQLDAFYNFRRGTALGGKRGMKVHANFSTYYSLTPDGSTEGSHRLFTDFSFDVEKQFTKEFKMVLLYSLQDYDKVADGRYIGMSHTVVADLLYKFTSRFSTRLELQYLASKEYMKDWMAALVEVNFAPNWSVWASDMYNHGDSRKHYYNAGVSFAKGRTRLAVGYGRYRAGFICSGGVCRAIPAYTGANFSLTTSF